MHVLLMNQPKNIYDEQKAAFVEASPALGCKRIRKQRSDLTIGLVVNRSPFRPYRFLKIFPPCPLISYRILVFMKQCMADPNFTSIPKEFLREASRSIQHPELDLNRTAGFELHERLGLTTVSQYRINALIAIPEPEVLDHLLHNLMDRRAAIATEQLRQEAAMDRICRSQYVEAILAQQGTIAVPPYMPLVS